MVGMQRTVEFDFARRTSFQRVMDCGFLATLTPFYTDSGWERSIRSQIPSLSKQTLFFFVFLLSDDFPSKGIVHTAIPTALQVMGQTAKRTVRELYRVLCHFHAGHILCLDHLSIRLLVYFVW